MVLPGAGDLFGLSVSISGDYAIVGAIGNGGSNFRTAVKSPRRPAGTRHECEQVKPHP